MKKFIIFFLLFTSLFANTNEKSIIITDENLNNLNLPLLLPLNSIIHNPFINTTYLLKTKFMAFDFLYGKNLLELEGQYKKRIKDLKAEINIKDSIIDDYKKRVILGEKDREEANRLVTLFEKENKIANEMLTRYSKRIRFQPIINVGWFTLGITTTVFAIWGISKLRIESKSRNNNSINTSANAFSLKF